MNNKPNLNKIIADNLDKAKFQSKSNPRLPKNGWLDDYAYGGYISDRAKATQFGQYKRGGGYFPEYKSFAPPRMNEGTTVCYDDKGNVIPCEQKRLQELGSDAYTAMQPFYETLYGAANKYADKKTGEVSPFNSTRATLKALVKHPGVMFMKRHRIPSELMSMDADINPYHVQGYRTSLPLGEYKDWYPTDWAEPRKQRPGLGDWFNNMRSRQEDNRMRRKAKRDAGKTGCWGANCYEEENLDQAEYGGLAKYQIKGQVSQADSVRHLAGQMMDYEARKGSPSGTGLSDWGYHSSQLPYNKVSSNWHAPQTRDEAVDLYMQEIGTNPILGYFNTAMEKGEAGDFLYNTGRDPRVYMLDQYLKSKGQSGLPNRGSYNVDTKTPKWTPELQGSLDEVWNQYAPEINKLSENQRRILLNKGRDFYYQNINQVNGKPNPAYEATWKPRIWESVNTYKQQGGDISIPDLNSDRWLTKYQTKGQVSFSLPDPRNLQREMVNRVDVPTTIQEKQRKEAEAEEINKRNRVTAKRQFVGPARATTIDDERKRIMKNQAYAASHPYTKIDEQGNLSRAQWDRSMEGVADKYTTAAGIDKGLEHFTHALEAAGAAQGLGALGSAVKRGLTKSVESGLLSKLKSKVIPLENIKANSINNFELFDLNNVRKASGSIGNQGATPEGARDILKSIGIEVKGIKSGQPTFKEMVEHLKNNPKDAAKYQKFLEKEPINISELPDESFQINDGHHRATLAYYSGNESIPAIIKNKGEYIKLPQSITTEDLVDLYRVQEKGFDINSNTVAQMEKAAAEGRLSPVQKMMLNNEYDRKRLMARDKFWGQWFEKDPKRLEYYVKDKGPDSEILHIRVPRSEAPNYSIKNFESQEPIKGAPLEYHQRMSLSPETEFILPKDIIQGAKKYPLSEWERLIKEHKPWMGVLPLAGAAALEQKKKGGMITDSRGQWAHPGQNTRIPGSNITMQGVPYPVLAKASNGMTTMMYPNREYSFPGASHVDEYPMTGWLNKYQEGGTQYTVKPGDTLTSIAQKNKTTLRRLIDANNIDNPNLIRANQNLVIPSLSSNDQYKNIYQDWNTIRDKQQAINASKGTDEYSPDEQIITSYYNEHPNDSYVVVDKKRARMNVYKGNKLQKSYEVGTGANPGDAQTVTRVVNGKTDWDSGNRSTGAGVYTISNIDPQSHEYFGLPAFNLKNDRGMEVATTIHGTPMARRAKFDNNNIADNRMSYGCINGKCYDLKDLYGRVDVGSNVYILPEDAGNQFQIVDGKPVLRVDAKNRAKYNTYTDKTGNVQKGQGVNQSINTLQYKPIRGILDKKQFQESVYQGNDFNDEEEYKSTTKPFFNALVNNKQKIMKSAKIPSDVYNELAKMAFGIYGTESNFGDTHSTLGNFGRAVSKVLNPSGSSSPDYKSKATTYGADEDNRSVGLTQLRWNYLNEDEKKALKELGITSNKDFLDPTKAAMGTVAVLGIRYNQQLTSDEKKDIWKNLPTRWNKRSNYADRVKNNSRYIRFEQLEPTLKQKPVSKVKVPYAAPQPTLNDYFSYNTLNKYGGQTNNWLSKYK